MATFAPRPIEYDTDWYAEREAYDQSLETAITANETALDSKVPTTRTVAGIIEVVTLLPTDDGARVTLAGLTRGELYELTVTGATADDRVITAALAIRCVV